MPCGRADHRKERVQCSHLISPFKELYMRDRLSRLELGIERERHDMTWYDMTWHDMTWHDMTWHDMTWHDMTWHDMTWHDMTWHDITLCTLSRISVFATPSKSSCTDLLQLPLTAHISAVIPLWWTHVSPRNVISTQTKHEAGESLSRGDFNGTTTDK